MTKYKVWVRSFFENGFSCSRAIFNSQGKEDYFFSLENAVRHANANLDFLKDNECFEIWKKDGRKEWVLLNSKELYQMVGSERARLKNQFK